MAAAAPGILLLCYFYLKDKYHSEPIRIVARMFLAGALVVLPIIVILSAVRPYIGDTFVVSVGLSAGLEEFIKWFIVYFLIYKNEVFDEPYDGIVYAVAVSLGFATVENIFYALLQPDFVSLLLRAMLPVTAHAMFGVTMGYYLGRAKFAKDRERTYIGLSLLYPAGYHALFNGVMLISEWWLVAAVPLMIYLWVRTNGKVRRANSRSPYNKRII